MERHDDLDDRVQAAAEEMEADIEEMEHHSDEVGEDIDDARSDWKRKQEDSSIPGAEADEDDDAGAGDDEPA
jgi:hypothetical protein